MWQLRCHCLHLTDACATTHPPTHPPCRRCPTTRKLVEGEGGRQQERERERAEGAWSIFNRGLTSGALCQPGCLPPLCHAAAALRRQAQ